MSVLVNMEEVDFTFLKQKVNTSDGNLSVHLGKLEKAGYIAVTKEFVEKKPRTSYRITKKGRTDFEAYINHLDEIVNSTTDKEE
jgi:DNA-binding PadR family transcriptional regulator